MQKEADLKIFQFKKFNIPLFSLLQIFKHVVSTKGVEFFGKGSNFGILDLT